MTMSDSRCSSGGCTDGDRRSSFDASGECCSTFAFAQHSANGLPLMDPVLLREEGEATSALDDQAPLVTDWQLLRKFAKFWPVGAGGPPDLPWLGTLVSRRKAWRWVSQFPQRFSTVSFDELSTITAFIAETLADVEPDGVNSEKGDKTCCKKKPKEPIPPPDHPPLPGDAIPPYARYCTQMSELCSGTCQDVKEFTCNPQTGEFKCTCQDVHYLLDTYGEDGYGDDGGFGI